MKDKDKIALANKIIREQSYDFLAKANNELGRLQITGNDIPNDKAYEIKINLEKALQGYRDGE